MRLGLFFIAENHFAVTVAAVAVVVTVGFMKKMSFTLTSHAVGLSVPVFIVMLPLPRLGAVISKEVLGKGVLGKGVLGKGVLGYSVGK